MAQKILPAGLKAGGLRSAKLADMRGAKLDIEHQAWLDQMIAQATGGALTDVHIHVIGFASSEGDAAKNRALSKERAWAVRDYINARSEWLASRVQRFEGRGEDESSEFGRDLNTEGDPDDFRWRAVEVHLTGNFKPVPAPDEEPDAPQQALPGASTKWGFGSVGSLSFSIPGAPGASVGLGFYVFAKLDQDKGAGLYVSAPVGFSLSASNVLKMLRGENLNSDDALGKQLKEILIKAIMTGTLKGLFTKLPAEVRVENAFRHKDLNLHAGISEREIAVLKVVEVSGKLPTFNRYGKIVRYSTKTYFQKDSLQIPLILPTGIDTKLDVTLAKLVGGGLLRLAWL
jgi:hypothetical protein